jgi:hypothetical protein
MANNTIANPLNNNSGNTLNNSLDMNIINHYKVFFDKEPGMVTDVYLTDGHYYIVRYNNWLPFTSGYEIFNSDGTRITDPNDAKRILQTVAWTEAIKSVSDLDIQSLNNIWGQTESINQTINPVVSTSNLLMDFLNFQYSLKKYGINNGALINIIIGIAKGADVSYDVAAYGLNDMNNQLNDLNNATYSLNDDLPYMINYIKLVKSGYGYADSSFKITIEHTSSNFDVLQNKIGLADKTIDSVLTVGNLTLNIEKFAEGAVGCIPLIGNNLQDFLNGLIKVTNDLQNEVAALKTYADSLSTSITIEKNTLNKIADTANQKSDDYINGWNNRQTAWLRVIAIPVFIILLLILVVIYLYYKKNP